MARTLRRIPSLLAGASLALATPSFAADGASVASIRTRVDGIEMSLGEAENRLDFVEKEYVQKKDASDAQLRSERFAKGVAAFNDGDFNTASILFYDLCGIQEFKSDPNYDDAVYYLAEALYKQQNLLGARTYFRETLNLHRSHYREALARYLEISGRINDFSNIEQYVDAAKDATGNLPAEVGYVYGKWLFRRSDVPLAERAKRAAAALKPVADGMGTDKLAAQYLMGVLEVQQGNFDEAIELYNALVKQAPRDDREKQIIELAHLARGRIYYEQSKYTEAIDAYQNVDRNSENFVPALYEISWVFVKKGEYEKALRSTEILDELAPDSITAPEARILRAHLYLKLAKYQDASQTYKDVINTYAPVRDEVDALLKLHDDPVKYFDDLLAQNDKDFNVTSLLPPAAAKWATTQQEVADAVRMTGDLGQSRKGVSDSNDLAQQILKAIDEKGVNAFPFLQEGFSKAEAVDATLTTDARDLLGAQQELLAGNLGELAGQLEAARKERESLESKFRSLPKTDSEVTERRNRYKKRIEELDRTAFGLQTQVEGLNATLNSIEKWVNDTRAQRTKDPEAEKKFLTDVKDNRVVVSELASAISDLRRSLKEEQLRSGNVVGDEQIRSQYQAALDKEQQILSRASAQLGSEGQSLTGRIAQVQQRISADRARVASAKLQLQTAVANKAESIRRQVEEEQGKLRTYAGEVDTISSDARNLVGRIAYDSFKRVRKQFYDLVLKADVGMIDVAWTKKQDDTNKIQTLSKQKDKELKSLDDDFKEVLKDVD